MRLTAIVVALALCLCTVAQGKSYWQRAYPIAVAYWGKGEPCGGDVTVHWATLESNEGARASFAPDQTSVVPTHGCVVTYSTRVHWNWGDFCHVTAHEIGHLLGYQHTTAIGVMNPALTYKVRVHGCRRH